VKALAAAFRATTYRVEAGERHFDLRIGKTHDDFDGFLRELAGDDVLCWAIVTAVNPGGVRNDEENDRRQSELACRIRELGRRVLPACNLADDDKWPVEPSLLLVGADEQDACELASEFRQAACVCGNIGGKARLVWCKRA
jgi:hypothetical protein